jgi:hypothetical protein
MSDDLFEIEEEVTTVDKPSSDVQAKLEPKTSRSPSKNEDIKPIKIIPTSADDVVSNGTLKVGKISISTKRPSDPTNKPGWSELPPDIQKSLKRVITINPMAVFAKCGVDSTKKKQKVTYEDVVTDDRLFNLITDPSWREALASQLSRPYWKDLSMTVRRLRKEEEVYPAEKLTFAALNDTPLSSVRVVIIGQVEFH